MTQFARVDVHTFVGVTGDDIHMMFYEIGAYVEIRGMSYFRKIDGKNVELFNVAIYCTKEQWKIIEDRLEN